MKTSLKTSIAFMLLFSALTVAASASPVRVFSIQNLTSFPVGKVVIVTDDGDRTRVDVSGPGEFTATIRGKVDKVIINNQSINKHDGPIDVSLDSGFVVQVTLTNDQIVVTDQSIIFDETKNHSQKNKS